MIHSQVLKEGRKPRPTKGNRVKGPSRVNKASRVKVARWDNNRDKDSRSKAKVSRANREIAVRWDNNRGKDSLNKAKHKGNRGRKENPKAAHKVKVSKALKRENKGS